MGRPSISSVKVPSEGNLEAKVLLVGEAPGKEESKQLRPFVGQSGSFLEKYLQRAGFARSEVFLSNLCKYRPRGNKFPILNGSPQLEEGLEELRQDIKLIKPNVVVALGNWPLWYLTGERSPKKNAKQGTGISTWRGSVVPGIGPAEGWKVLATYHPSYVMRAAGFKWHPIFLNDLKRLKAHAATPDMLYPEYVSHIDPADPSPIVEEMLEADWLAVDIETFGESLACVGFADSEDRGLCITFENPHGWDPARVLLASDVPKIYQFGTFDVNYLDHYYPEWEVNNFAFDTYIAAANLLPEFPKGLDFMCSIYTEFPFYKEERKEWKRDGDMSSLWEYNVKDCVATYMIAMQQREELEALYGGGD